MTNRLTQIGKWAASLLCALAVSGCGCKPDFFFSSTGECVAVAAGVVLLAPVWVPAVLISKAVDEHSLNKYNNEARAENWRLLQAEDPATVAACVIGCDVPLVSANAEEQRQREVYWHGVDLVIAWWGKDPRPAQIPALMVAYLRKGESLMQSDPARADSLLRQAAAWSTDPRIVEGLEASEFGATDRHGHYRNGGYYDNDIAKSIQKNLMILRYRGIAGRQPDLNILKDRCQAIAAWPPAWRDGEDKSISKEHLSSACGSAYRELFGKEWSDKLPVIIDSVIDPLSKQERQTPQTSNESSKPAGK